MDLLKAMMSNRQRANVPAIVPGAMPTPATPTYGTKKFRKHIIDNKPSKKEVKKHFEILIEKACASSDEDDSELE